MVRKEAARAESVLTLMGHTTADGDDCKFTLLPTVEGRPRARSKTRSGSPHDSPSTTRTTRSMRRRPRRWQPSLTHRSATGKPRVELVTFEPNDSGVPPMLNGTIAMTQASADVHGAAVWGADVPEITEAYTVEFEGNTYGARAYRPAPSCVLQMDPDVAAEYYATVLSVAAGTESAVVSQSVDGGARPRHRGDDDGVTGTTVIEIVGLGQGATAEPVMAADGTIASLSVTSQGSGYFDARVDIDGFGSGADCRAVVVGGQVTGYTMVSEGSGYIGARVFWKQSPYTRTSTNQGGSGRCSGQTSGPTVPSPPSRWSMEAPDTCTREIERGIRGSIPYASRGKGPAPWQARTPSGLRHDRERQHPPAGVRVPTQDHDRRRGARGVGATARRDLKRRKDHLQWSPWPLAAGTAAPAPPRSWTAAGR